MKNSFLFKREGFYHLQYIDEYSKKTRISTRCKKKSDALIFLKNFEKANKPKINIISIKDFFELYKTHVKNNLSIKYYNDINTTVKELLDFIGDIPLSKVNTITLDNFVSQIAKKSKHQSRKHYNNLRSALNKAVTWGYLQDNPILKFRPIKVPLNNPVFINEYELQLIVEKEPDERLQNIYKTAFYR